MDGASLRNTKNGFVPEGSGWFVLNASESRWRDGGPLAVFCTFEGKQRFPQIGINISVLQPGQPMAMYHRENGQEAFVVAAGQCMLIVEGEERQLRTSDFFHCPPKTEHVIVATGDEPAVVVAAGARGRGGPHLRVLVAQGWRSDRARRPRDGPHQMDMTYRIYGGWCREMGADAAAMREAWAEEKRDGTDTAPGMAEGRLAMRVFDSYQAHRYSVAVVPSQPAEAFTDEWPEASQMRACPGMIRFSARHLRSTRRLPPTLAVAGAASREGHAGVTPVTTVPGTSLSVSTSS